MTDSREKILARVREALRVPAPGPHGEPREHPRALEEIEGGFRRWLPDPGASPSDWEASFARNAEALKAEFVKLETATALAGALRDLAAREGWRRVAAHPHPLLDEAVAALDLPTFQPAPDAPVDELERCDAGITACDALVAQTGSVLVTTRSAGGRALSVLPPHHVVVATRDQLIPDLPAAFELLRARYRDGWPSFLSFITGPSRTGDIERILVLGAHGPKKLTIFLLGQNP